MGLKEKESKEINPCEAKKIPSEYQIGNTILISYM